MIEVKVKVEFFYLRKVVEYMVMDVIGFMIMDIEFFLKFFKK